MTVYRFTKETLPSSDFHPTSPATASPVTPAQPFTPLSQSREPGKPIDYHYEKAIADIKRDRGH